MAITHLDTFFRYVENARLEVLIFDIFHLNTATEGK
jgi:hypothetical protein